MGRGATITETEPIHLTGRNRQLQSMEEALEQITEHQHPGECGPECVQELERIARDGIAAAQSQHAPETVLILYRCPECHYEFTVDEELADTFTAEDIQCDGSNLGAGDGLMWTEEMAHPFKEMEKLRLVVSD